MTAHRRALELATAAIDWDLSQDERTDLADHLRSCTACRHADAVQRRQATAIRAITYPDTPAFVRRAVMAAATGGTHRNRRPTWTLLAAATLTALIGLGSVVVGAYLAELERGPISVDGPTDPRPTIDATPLPSITPPRSVAELERLRWTALPDAAVAFDGAALSSVTTGPSGLVAIGQASPTLETLVWLSPDGNAWQNVPQPSDVFGGGVPTHVVAGGPGLVAVGWDISVERGTQRAIWTSPDGRVWTPDPDPSGRFGSMNVLGLASADGVILVLASEAPGGDPIAMRSSDGLRWERSDAPDGLAPGVSGVAQGVTGFVAFGPVNSTPQAWFSDDGMSWTVAMITSDGGTVPGPGGVIERVVRSGSRLLAQGSSESNEMSVLTSADGRRWLAAPAAQIPGGGPTIADGRGAFIAVLPPVQPNAAIVAWTSADGGTWTLLANSPLERGTPAIEPAVTLTQAVSIQNGWILFGYETGTGRVLLWSIR